MISFEYLTWSDVFLLQTKILWVPYLYSTWSNPGCSSTQYVQILNSLFSSPPSSGLWPSPSWGSIAIHSAARAGAWASNPPHAIRHQDCQFPFLIITVLSGAVSSTHLYFLSLSPLLCKNFMVSSPDPVVTPPFQPPGCCPGGLLNSDDPVAMLIWMGLKQDYPVPGHATVSHLRDLSFPSSLSFHVPCLLLTYLF